MKTKLLLIGLFMAVSTALFSQTFFWESFDNAQMPPAGWTISGLNAQWSVGNSNNAGGLAPEAKFTYIQQTTTTRLISPNVNTTGLTTVKFSFRFFYDWYSNPAPKIGVATRSHNGSWTSAWEATPTANMGPMQKDIDITTADVGQDEFQVCVYLNGNMYNLDYVYVDNLLLYNPLNLDGAMISLAATPTYFADPIEVKGTIMNAGITTITDAEIKWQMDGGDTHTTTLAGLGLSTQQMYDFTCEDLLSATIGEHHLKVWINTVNGTQDDYRPNDTLEMTLYRVCITIPKKPLFEEFTSSTCGPCAQFNSGFVPWCNQHDTSITLIKYQMSWPAPGDIYYTEQGGGRRTFYGVNAVPALFCNGGEVATSVADVQVAYDQALTQIGMMDIVGTHTLSAGHVIDVHATVLPFTDFSNSNVYVVVMEETTYNNHSTNGETSFEHVMMKMIPDSAGVPTTLTDRTPFTYSKSVDLTGTHMERWDDVIVGIFVQDQGSHMVYQSTYSVQDAVYNTEARLQSLESDGTLVQGFASDTYEYTIKLPSGTTLVPTVTGTAIDPKALVIIVPANELPGATTIDVFAEDRSTHKLYTVNFEVSGVGISDPKVKNIVAYPNPTTGLFYLLNAEHSSVTVTTTSGAIVKYFPDFTGASVNLNSLPKGVYILSVETADKTVIRKKIVLY